jgi:hypothetical protein
MNGEFAGTAARLMLVSSQPLDDTTNRGPMSASKPDLLIRQGDLTTTARDLASLIASSGRVFLRDVPVRVASASACELPRVEILTADRVAVEAHLLARPVKLDSNSNRSPATLPERVARLYLALDQRDLPPLKGITGAPLLSPDGAIRATDGYDAEAGLWCANIPTIDVPLRPSIDDARRALRSLREAFQTFPFADAVLTPPNEEGVPTVDLSLAPAYDETAFLVGLLTAVCRASLTLAPGLAIAAPQSSGSGTGKGLLVRTISAIAFGVMSRAFTKGGGVAELDKRIASELMEAAPVLFLDNVNVTDLRSELLASVLSEKSVGCRVLGVSRMVRLNSCAFVAVTGNGLCLSEDLMRRFIRVELDAKTEDPEGRRFAPGFLDSINARRPELLTAALTILRWGRQHENELVRGRPLGSYETWSPWVRDPLLTLGCADPVDRIAQLKASDPERARIAAIFTEWHERHGERPVTVGRLDPKVVALIDPQSRSRQFAAAAVAKLAGTRAAGFVLTRQDPAGRWGVTTYALRRTAVIGDGHPAP